MLKVVLHGAENNSKYRDVAPLLNTPIVYLLIKALVKSVFGEKARVILYNRILVFQRFSCSLMFLRRIL